ncbi:MAG: hypothetical protein ACLP0J_16865 [Solirubrobacteraceae bacterium]
MDSLSTPAAPSARAGGGHSSRSGDEWRVLLTLKTIRADDGRPYPLVLAAVGDAPPQYPGAADAA